MNNYIDSAEYEHPTDKVALDALKKVPLLDTVLTWWLNLNVRTDYLIDYRGNGLEVNERTCPRVWRLKQTAMDRLSIKEDIPMFITQEWEYNAFAVGASSPMIVLHSGIVEDFTDAELLYIIGHEMGHVKSRHMLYHYMAANVAEWAFNSDIVGALAMEAIVIALMEWQRKSELTADRAGFIANQNKEACIWGMIKLMGLPEDYHDSSKYSFTIDDMTLQYDSCKEDLSASKIQKIMYAFITAKLSHPWTIQRIHEIQKWDGIQRD